MNFNRSCREVTRLVLESEERELPLADRLALQIHWRICDGCSKFREQARLMRDAMTRWRGYRDAEGDGGGDSKGDSDEPPRS